ncbi:MAG: dihydroorotase [Bdellovibrionales bacterium]
MRDILNLSRPFDAHVHLREGAVLRAVLPFTAKVFSHAIVMPNLHKPITTKAQAKAYREEILAAMTADADFTPLMTLYLTDTTDPDDLAQGFDEKIVTAAKLYPVGATTNSEHGVSDIKRIYKVLVRMQRIGMPLLIHGEVTDPSVDIFDREAAFINRVLIPLRHDFPELKIVLEHITTKEAASYIAEEGEKGRLAATITAHHLHINRNALLAGGLHPHYYCMPIAKRESHRQAILEAATSGKKMFFLGTDSAPHVDAAKESACGCAGIFTAANALELYAQAFDGAGKLENLEAFACRNGAAFYGLPVNAAKVTARREAPEDIKPILTEDGQKITAFTPSSPLLWRTVL